MSAAAIEPRELPSELVGGRLCLDFANTVHSRHESPLRDYLSDYQALLGWAELAGSSDPETLRQLARLAAEHPQAAQNCRRQALELREAIYRLFEALINSRQPAEADVTTFNDWLSETSRHRRLHHAGHGFERRWHVPGTRLDSPLWPIVESAAELLTSESLDRVHVCPGAGGCGWLFLDTSKNRSRRWCSMRTCGNVAKARRHYRKNKGSGLFSVEQ